MPEWSSRSGETQLWELIGWNAEKVSDELNGLQVSCSMLITYLFVEAFIRLPLAYFSFYSQLITCPTNWIFVLWNHSHWWKCSKWPTGSTNSVIFKHQRPLMQVQKFAISWNHSNRLVYYYPYEVHSCLSSFVPLLYYIWEKSIPNFCYFHFFMDNFRMNPELVYWFYTSDLFCSKITSFLYNSIIPVIKWTPFWFSSLFTLSEMTSTLLCTTQPFHYYLTKTPTQEFWLQISTNYVSIPVTFVVNSTLPSNLSDQIFY